MKVLTVVGARPQFIKAAPVSAEFARRGIREVLVHTGQHYDHALSRCFFDELGISEPDENLAIGSGPHGEQTARMMIGLEGVITAQRPDWVLVYGDTNSTLAGALVASKAHVPLVHVEAGMRSFDRAMPEEINRVVTDHVSDLLLTSTIAATLQLAAEGIPNSRIRQVGDVMYDAALRFGERADAVSESVAALDLAADDYVLVTVHRAATTDDPVRLRAVVEGFVAVSDWKRVVWPLHPRTRRRLEDAGLLERVSRQVDVIPPCSYLDMIRLIRFSAVVATDSGGLQKESFFHRRPCVTLRTETEWVETVELGWNRLVAPDDSGAIAAAIQSADGVSGSEADPYGDGRASVAIADVLSQGL